MCGIFGITFPDDRPLGNILIEAGHRLSYRGYDSVGCAALQSNQSIDLRKDVGKVAEVAERLNFAELVGQRGILQLRWATFGVPSQVNAQPHLDSDGDLVGAHNGNVVNNIELRQKFIDHGLLVRSENDGESCVHAVELYADQGKDFITAIQYAYCDLAGDYAFVIGSLNDNCLYAVKKGSGLVAGIGEGFTCVSSDLPSILPLTRQIIRIEDGEIAILYAHKVEIIRISDGEKIHRSPEIVTESMNSAQKSGYAHFMLKEIHEQPQVASQLLHLLDNYAELSNFIQRVRSAKNIYLIGCGTSYHACLLGAIYLARLAGKPAIPVLAPQFIVQYGPALTEQDVGIFVSQSGETKDVLNALELGRQKGISILGMVNVIGSTLMRASEYYLPLVCGYEISVPATKTFTNQVISFLYLALCLGNRTTAHLHEIPDLMQETLRLSEPQIDPLMPHLKDVNDLYCLGYGLTYPIALEASLKLKEITYAHCEGMLSTEFKHGPLSAVVDGYPVIYLAGNEDTHLLVSGINEVTCRGGFAIAVGEDNPQLRANAHHFFELPHSSPEIAALLAVIPMQLLSYRLSLARGFDPDFPRNLSKTLTVD